MPLLLFALLFARFAAGGRIASGISIAGVKVGGLTAAEAEQRLTERSRALANEKLRLVLGGREASITIEELGLELSSRESAARALNVARGASAFANAARYLRSVFVAEPLPAALHVDRARLTSALARLEPMLVDDPPTAGGLTVESGVARVTPPRSGHKIAVGPALGAISDAVANGRTASPLALSATTFTPELKRSSLERALALATRVLSRPVTLEQGARRLQIEPAELGAVLATRLEGDTLELSLDPARFEAWLATQRAALEAPARDARFEVTSRDEVRVVPAEPGVQLPSDAVAKAVWAAAQTDEHRGELPLSATPEPARTTEQADKLGIRGLVGSFTTRHPCCQPRVDNIHRVATLLDGLIVDPGQTVSINTIVGPRTQKNGFVLAPSIEDGEMVDTFGGGVSQFATTFFNALFRAGYDIIERKPHTYWFPRYPMGIEATLSWPHPDIVFKNDSAAGLLVKTSFTDTSVTVKLYGDAGGRRVSFNVSERRDIIPPTLELLPNRAVPSDEEKVKEGGMIGWSVIVSRTVTFADGTKKEEKRKVTYKPKPRRVDVHPCRIPKGQPGATGEPCPEPEPKDDQASSEAPPQAG
ncbi:MAG TPA: VanW family protein [Polyangiaceae bacterium]|nr:VanW family protein [Polyangiaceae bacterium]